MNKPKEQQEEQQPVTHELKEAIVSRLLGESINDPELQEITQTLASWAKLLKAKPSDAMDGFRENISHHHAQFLSLSETKKLNDQMNDLRKYFEIETARVKSTHDSCNSEINSYGSLEAYKDEKDKLISQVTRDYNKMKSEYLEMDKMLKSIGYTDEVSDESVKKMEQKVNSLQEEYSKLNKEMSKFEGLEPNESSIRRKIQLIKEEIEKVDDLLPRGGCLNQSYD